ncbi:uncharacterized protein M421DRAFT_250574, partial [Didymella exigua CBS 183.55]
VKLEGGVQTCRLFLGAVVFAAAISPIYSYTPDLDNYRARIAQSRIDLDLSLAHQKSAWITTWDDHEVSNNGCRDDSSVVNNTESSFFRIGGVSVDQRKMDAVRAYFECMPIRQVNLNDDLHI